MRSCQSAATDRPFSLAPASSCCPFPFRTCCNAPSVLSKGNLKSFETSGTALEAENKWMIRLGMIRITGKESAAADEASDGLSIPDSDKAEGSDNKGVDDRI